MIYLLLLVLLLTLGGCSAGSGFMGLFGGDGGGEGTEYPPEDLGSKVVEILPDLMNSGAYVLATFVYTAIAVAIFFSPARAAAVGVFIAFYTRITYMITPKALKPHVEHRSIPKPPEPDGTEK